MGWREPQNPGLGGLDELTSSEETFVQNLAGLSYSKGDILYHDGNNLVTLGIGADGEVLTVATDIPSWSASAGSGDFSGPASSTDNAIVRFDGTGGKTGQNSGVTIDDSDNVTGVNQLDVDSVNGIDVNPGSDADADLLTVGVTGAPKLQWDESQDAFKFTKGIEIDDNTAITFGTGFDATLQWDGTDLILDYDSQGGGTTDFRIQENSTDRFVIETGGNITTGVWNATDIAVADGGTGASDADTARTNLGLAIGSDVQAYDAQLDDIAALAVTDGNIIVGDGTNWVAESGATARTSLGLGTGDSPQFTAIELGHASDTTIARVSAGVASIEGNNIITANRTASTNQTGIVELATTTETNTGTDTTRAVTPGGLSSAVKSIMLTAAGGAPLTTAGCSDPTKIEFATNDINTWVLDFDQTSEEHAFWSFPMPENWDAGTVNAQFYWTAAAGSATEGVVWGIAGGSWGDDDALDAALGTEVETTDTLIATDDLHISAKSSAVTIANAAAGEWINLVVARKVGNASDTLAADARLIAVKLTYTIDQYSDEI